VLPASRKRKASCSSREIPPANQRRAYLDKKTRGPVIPLEGPSTWVQGIEYGVTVKPPALVRFERLVGDETGVASDRVIVALSTALKEMSSTTLSHVIPDTINSMFLSSAFSWKVSII
jgi:hypothetical protein